jgi:hypothetical protein
MVNHATHKQRQVRVLMMTQNTLLGDVLESILSQTISLLVHRILFASADVFWQATDDYQPEVIILEDGFIHEGSLCLSRQWADNDHHCIILVSPQENQIQVHNKFQYSITHVTDFISLVENCPNHRQNAVATELYQTKLPGNSLV